MINMVHRIQELSMGYTEGRLEMSLIGGFTHVLRFSEQVFYGLMGNKRMHISRRFRRNRSVARNNEFRVRIMWQNKSSKKRLFQFDSEKTDLNYA